MRQLAKADTESRNLRYTARGRPHRRHRVYSRTLKLAFRSCFSIRAFFAIFPSLSGCRRHDRDPLEGEPSAEQRPAVVVRLGRRPHRDIHAFAPWRPCRSRSPGRSAARSVQREVAMTVERVRFKPLKSRMRGIADRDEPVDELPHPVAAERHLPRRSTSLAELEPGDGLPPPCHDGLLTGE